MSYEQRIARQERFIMDETKIICATIAFGMGIDKSNIRRVIHYNLSKNIEGYYQEIGRAGRDGLPADAILFYSYGDIVQLTRFANESGNRAVQLSKLERIKQYAESLTCRRQILLHYFGESRTVGCGNCDVCTYPPAFIDGTEIAQKALSTIKRLREKEPMSVVIDVLRGSRNATIVSRGYDKISTHGIGNDIVQQDWQRYLIQLLNLGLCEIAFDQRDALKLTEASERVLFQDEEVLLAKPHQEHISNSKAKTLEKLKKATTVDTLFERLKTWRYALSKEK